YFVRKDKKVVPVEENVVYLYNGAGKRIGVVGIVRDITERKQAEEKLRETTTFLDSIIENSLDCIIVADSNGYLTRVNKYFLDLLGYEKTEVLGKHISELAPIIDVSYESITGDVIKIDKERYDRELAVMSKLVEEGELSNWEFYLVGKDKKVIPVEENIVYLCDGNGKRIGTVAILRNIGERKKAEREIIEARDFLEDVFKTSVDGIITTDCKGTITMANRAVEEILGYSKGELIGKHTTELGPKGEKHKESVAELMAKIIEKGFVSGVEHIWVKQDGTLIDVELNAAILRDSKDDIKGLVASVRDITGHKQAERSISDYQNQLRSLASQLVLTEERERRRIATDLHDRIGQALAISKIKLGALRESASSIGLDSEVDGIRDLVEQT
ncbi:PAS domain S-box protein, partial [bacterium]|nr:PAS domain S-box protein [bacterium]